MEERETNQTKLSTKQGKTTLGTKQGNSEGKPGNREEQMKSNRERTSKH